ncbi:MAG: adenosylmethionine--8-amino-7-oxononanoate transaminase [Sedimenticolaceae bacterium]
MNLVDRDRQHIWHPYSAVGSPSPIYPVVAAEGVRLKLDDGRELIDGMSSWWCAVHGYNHPVLNEAAMQQLDKMSHVMFGGLTHPPAVELAETLVELSPWGLQKVFFVDSGSVAIEAAMKMALQTQIARGQSQRHLFLSPRGGYHGDTLDAMSVCDPITGMHTLFQGVLPKQVFIERPEPAFGEHCTEQHLAQLKQVFAERGDQLAAMILEPIVQGAGGMRFYAPEYLQAARRLCDEHGVLLIADEIATGFGRSGKLFAVEHADITPDILCVGKALTGGYLSLAAVLTTDEMANDIASGEPGVFMHGPTFMGNPLACAIAKASIDLLCANDWQQQVLQIEQGLHQGLAPAKTFTHVAEVRVLGAIGVVELSHPVDMSSVQPMFVERGVWVRPFGKLVYLMPPFVMSSGDLAQLTDALVDVVANLQIKDGVAVPLSA